MRALIRVTGAVQGIGYRPFVAELATKYKLNGEVKNLGGIVEIIVDGDVKDIRIFADKLKTSAPSGSIVIKISLEYQEENEPEGPSDFSGFRIVESSEDTDNSYLPVFPPDIGICTECKSELFNFKDRRYRYPLISCASCGPRFSILKQLPYDRETTSMDVFLMCPECSKEYRIGRRRHAQTISCHYCGPQMKYISFDNNKDSEDPVNRAIEIIRNGGIVGLKGVGGYQLVADPKNYNTVKRLREIKGREQKPFAVMFNSVEDIRKICNLSPMEESYLTSSARPIVLLDKKKNNHIAFAENVCGFSKQIGAFLPATGVHSLLTEKLGAIIATSGNNSGEPMITSDKEFLSEFNGRIDGILYYDRDILRPLDDSVIQIVKSIDGKEIPRFIRRARGYVPLPIFLSAQLEDKVLYQSFGADLKNTFAIGYGDSIIPSQFLGDMESYGILKLQKKELDEFEHIFKISSLNYQKRVVISDMHPGYYSSELARNFVNKIRDASLMQIQHHHAHIGSVMAEYGLKECIGIAFDGTGYGLDMTIWGSEFLVCKGGSFERVAHLKPVRIVGQDEGMKNAAIAAACYMNEYGLEVPGDILKPDDLYLIKAAIQNNINAFSNAGMGRLFDAVSCILRICNYNSYEGECAIKLQNSAEEYCEDHDAYNILKDTVTIEDSLEINVGELLATLLKLRNSADIGLIAYSFHCEIAETVKNICIEIRKKYGLNTVCLSGGVFANRLLLSMCEKLLCNSDFVVYYNSILPSNDGGISTGQIYLADLLQER
ncbi:carbamoyltransferase HypF [Butyrivibrio sp. AE3004]|uniref:carbamoyltransferase HypF n=1 Tax=Butyrivibrio sp. AE3004 TaxID=1506994 RepID=UPI0004946CE6|nr:carbamoyltransferase HypF [Butyrivibrio sp. AE3004]